MQVLTKHLGSDLPLSLNNVPFKRKQVFEMIILKLQAACHKDIQISSLAIQCLHDCATTLLNQQVELPHFHFNEALLKPFENLLCLELCDDDIQVSLFLLCTLKTVNAKSFNVAFVSNLFDFFQEQIISCICEFVETNRMEIRSGWRPLFNTLRAANNSNQYSAILEIFKVFLSTDNTLVFANAALDCILCLLSHIKGLHYDETPPTDVKPKKVTQLKPMLSLKFSKNSKFIPLSEDKTEKVIVDMCREALYHLENCADILTMMYNMPKCPIFNTGNKIKGDIPVSVVDPIIPNAFLNITNYITNEPCEEEFISYKKLSTSLSPSHTTNTCLLKLDKPSNILKVWYVLIEGLISATVVCSKKNQPAAMETLFKLLRNTVDVPGTHFGLHCINHLLLPMVQNWLRQISSVNSNWDSDMPNFKQCCGFTTDTLVVYLHHLQQINVERSDDDEINEDPIVPIESTEVSFALKQLMLILVECIGQPQEPVARLGASCIRHIILTSGHLLTDSQWEIVSTSLHRACNVSLCPLRQLTYAFKENSSSFYGDLAVVKVAARRDCTVNDNVRLHAMAQQVFLTDQVKGEGPKLTPKNSSQNLMLIDDRSYIFLIYLEESVNSLNPEMYTARITHRGLVVGLLAHQILVQIIATVLIQASSDVFQGINSILYDSLRTPANTCNYKFFLNNHNTELLLKSLELSFRRAMQFDSRPGLKFLVQKVSNLDHAANLYKQTTSSWLIKIIALTETFFNGVHKFKIKSTDISIILYNYTTSLNLTMEYDRFVNKIFDLKDTWELLCYNYVKHLINVSDFDDPETKEKDRISYCSVETDSSSTHYEQYYTQASVEQTEHPEESKNSNSDVVSQNENNDNEKKEDKVEVSEKPKPFTFADFKVNSQASISLEIRPEKETDILEEIDKTEFKYDDTNGPIIKSYEVNEDEESQLARDKGILEKENEKIIKNHRASDILEKHLNTHKGNHFITDGLAYEKPKNSEPFIIPPQPVPPEIEQQRALSISKVGCIRMIRILDLFHHINNNFAFSGSGGAKEQLSKYFDGIPRAGFNVFVGTVPTDPTGATKWLRATRQNCDRPATAPKNQYIFRKKRLI